MSLDEDNELRDLVAQTLEANGTLGKMGAQPRALEEPEKEQNETLFLNKKLRSFLATREGKLTASLVQEFLEFFGLKFTLAIFKPETGLNEQVKRSNLLKECNIPLSNAPSDTPLLTYLLTQNRAVASTSPSGSDDGLQIAKDVYSETTTEQSHPGIPSTSNAHLSHHFSDPRILKSAEFCRRCMRSNTPTSQPGCKDTQIESVSLEKRGLGEQTEQVTQTSSDAVTALEARIISQIEYYFSDVNLLCDKFLSNKIQEDDGWVTMDTMLKFSWLKKITDNAQMICEALKKSSSGLMEVSELGDKIRRSPSKPLLGDTQQRLEEIIARTVYAKPFPLDLKLDDLLEFFKDYGRVDRVVMKQHFQKKTFEGSVLVTFANKEDATKFVNEEETKFKEQALEVKCLVADCFKHKAAQKKANVKKDTEKKLHKKCDSEAKEEETEADLEERVSQKMMKNAVLHLKGLNSETSREQVKAFFSNVLQSHVAWVDFDKGATEGYIRLRQPVSAGSPLQKAKNGNDFNVIIKGSEVEIQVVEGKEELQYWKKMYKETTEKKMGRRQGESNQIDGRGEEQDTEGPPAKVTKYEKEKKT